MTPQRDVTAESAQCGYFSVGHHTTETLDWVVPTCLPEMLRLLENRLFRRGRVRNYDLKV